MRAGKTMGGAYDSLWGGGGGSGNKVIPPRKFTLLRPVVPRSDHARALEPLPIHCTFLDS